MNKVAFFLPVRAGSQRVKNKNTKSFAEIKGGLLASMAVAGEWNVRRRKLV